MKIYITFTMAGDWEMYDLPTKGYRTLEEAMRSCDSECKWEPCHWCGKSPIAWRPVEYPGRSKIVMVEV